MSSIRVRVRYLAPLFKELAGVEEEVIELRGDASLKALLDKVAELHGPQLAAYIVDEGERGTKPTVVVLVNGASINRLDYELRDGDAVDLLMLLDGGAV